jgi:hypothetical protein
MPQQFDTQLDTEPQADGCLTFVGGMYSNAKARLLKPEQASLIVDSDVSVTGSVFSRFGTGLIGNDVDPIGNPTSVSGLGYYQTATNTYEVAGVSTGVFRLSGANWSQLGSQTFGSGQITLTQGGIGGSVLGAVGEDKLHACGDATDIYQWDGSAWTNLSSPETTNSAPRNASILVWHTGRLVAAGASIKTRTADAAVVADAIYFSDILDPANWGAAVGGGTYSTQIRVGGGDGSEITAIVPWSEVNLAVFKLNSCWVVVADPTIPPASFEIDRVHPSVGCIAKRSAVQVGADVMFLSQDGVRSLRQTFASNNQDNLSVPLSYPIQDYIRRINWTHAGNAAATFWNNQYLLAAPLDTSTTNNFVFVYNTITSAWNGYWTNLPISCFAIRKSSLTQRLMMGLATDDKVIEYLDYVNDSDQTDSTYQDYNGNYVAPVIKTRAMTFGDPKAPKHGLDYELEWNNSKGVITSRPLLDDARDSNDPDDDTLVMLSGGFSIPFNIPFDIPGTGIQRQGLDLFRRGRFREFQLQITTSGAGKKELRQVTANAFVEPASPITADGNGIILPT